MSVPVPHRRDPRDVLSSVFGYGAFRGEQATIVEHVIAGGSCCVLMPTGSGKSLCYQIPALCRDGVGIVVSPLIALMDDQVAAMRQVGVRAAAIHSAMTPETLRDARQELAAGKLDLLYVAPERLLTPGFLDVLDTIPLALFAIDEAHCLSQWGHDFRPDYRQLSILRERFPHTPCIAVTATADMRTREDILQKLALPKLFTAGFDRPNISYAVAPKQNSRNQLLAFLNTREKDESGIVYCLSRRRVEDTAALLCDQGYDALPYHAGLDSTVRARNQGRFLKDEGVVMVATVAFGMGINKPDVRFVAHLDPPKTIEAYYQETGRAGRDGLPATAWMVYGLQDIAQLRQMIQGGDGPDEQKRLEGRKLDALLGYCEAAGCRRQILLGYFGDPGPRCGNCDTCLHPPKTFDATVAAQKALSCVYRTGERFGATYVINILLGQDDDRIRASGHDRVSTFGIGKEMAEAEWRSVLRQLVSRDLLRIDMGAGGGMRLTDDGAEFLRSRQTIELRLDERAAARATRRGRRSVGVTPPGGEHGAELLAKLKAERMAIAREQGVPPYVIFHDKTLVEMISAGAASLDDLASVGGVGQIKLERYGQRFVDILRAG